MKHIFLFLVHFIFMTDSACAESVLDFYSPEIKSYVIGENHFQENANLQIEIIEYLNSKTQTKEILLEVPKEVGVLFNNYINGNAEFDDVKSLTSLFNDQVEKNIITLLNYLLKYNSSKEENSKIKVRGIDLLCFDSFDRQLKAISILFKNLKNDDLTRRCLFEKTKKHDRKEAIRLIDLMCNDFDNNLQKYSSLLKEQAKIYREQLTQIETELKNNWKDFDSIREEYMFNELNRILETDAVRIIICGAAHALYKSKDSWLLGYPYTSFGSRFKEKYKNEFFVIILEYFERKKIRLFDEFNLLDKPIPFYFEKCKKIKFIVIPTIEIRKQALAFDRCDLIIIKGRR